jgi:hypothetical protein
MSDFAAPPAPSRVVELIPGEHYIVLTDSGDALPDEDVIGELRILAYARRNKETLGPGTAQVIATLAEAVATGVAADALWEECQEAKSFVDKLRSRRRERLRKADEAARRALEAIQAPQIPVAAPASAADITVSGTGADGTIWNASCKISDKLIEIQMDVCGNAIDVTIVT